MSLRVVVLLGDPGRPNSVMPDRPFGEDHLSAIAELRKTLGKLEGYKFEVLDDHANLIDELRRRKGEIDVVFNLCDEGYLNRPELELHVPALLELMGIPYTGAGPESLALCFDKSLVRLLAASMGISIPQGGLFDGSTDGSYPVLVKPARADGSWGITQNSVATTPAELLAAVEELRRRFHYSGPVLVEEFLTGKDFTVGIVGNGPDAMILPALEDSYEDVPSELPRLCGYEAKWLPDSPYWKVKPVPANLSTEQKEAVESASLAISERLKCRDYVRCDWRLDAAGRPHLLEVNPNPGWGWEGDGHFAKMARLAGMTYPDLLQAILDAARTRHEL